MQRTQTIDRSEHGTGLRRLEGHNSMRAFPEAVRSALQRIRGSDPRMYQIASLGALLLGSRRSERPAA